MSLTMPQQFTKEEAKTVTTENLSWTWPLVPVARKEQIKNRVNARLRSLNIPEVRDDVFSWRMSICVRDSRHNACKCRFRTCDISPLISIANRMAMAQASRSTDSPEHLDGTGA